MGHPIVYDRTRLHATLYKKGGRRHVFSARLQDLSDETGISYFHLSRIISGFVKEGRIRRLGRGQHLTQTFLVSDPVHWAGERGDLEAVQIARAELGDAD
jgi:hypothetical protein